MRDQRQKDLFDGCKDPVRRGTSGDGNEHAGSADPNGLAPIGSEFSAYLAARLEGQRQNEKRIAKKSTETAEEVGSVQADQDVQGNVGRHREAQPAAGCGEDSGCAIVRRGGRLDDGGGGTLNKIRRWVKGCGGHRSPPHRVMGDDQGGRHDDDAEGDLEGHGSAPRRDHEREEEQGDERVEGDAGDHLNHGSHEPVRTTTAVELARGALHHLFGVFLDALAVRMLGLDLCQETVSGEVAGLPEVAGERVEGGWRGGHAARSVTARLRARLGRREMHPRSSRATMRRWTLDLAARPIPAAISSYEGEAPACSAR